MKVIRDLVTRVGADGIALTVLGVVAIAIAIYDLLGGSNVSQPVLVGVLGLFLLELILQRGRIERTKEEIINSINGVRVEVFENGDDFSNAKFRLLLEAKDSLYDTEMCYARYVAHDESSFRQLLNERISNGQFTYKVVQVVYDPAHFEVLLERLFRFYKYEFYLGYFPAPPEVIPILNVMMYDRKHFIMGGYYGPSARGNDRNFYIRHNLVSNTLEQYFDYLWSKARLFNEHKAINWNEIKRCGLELGYTIESLNKTIERVAYSVGFKDIVVLQ